MMRIVIAKNVAANRLAQVVLAGQLSVGMAAAEDSESPRDQMKENAVQDNAQMALQRFVMKLY